MAHNNNIGTYTIISVLFSYFCKLNCILCTYTYLYYRRHLNKTLVGFRNNTEVDLRQLL